MTRLTAKLIKDVPEKVSHLDSELIQKINMNMRDFACYAMGVNANAIDFNSYTVAIVPVTSGKGVIGGFSESVAAAVHAMGMCSFVTEKADVAGISEAFSSSAEIIFMADDERFIALNTRTRSFSDNIWSTAKGYVTALSLAEGGLSGKTVLVIGAGRVGTEAVKILLKEGASVEVTDILYSRSEALEQRFSKVKAIRSVDQAIKDNRLILNASPGKISGKLIQDGAVISSPGVPYAFDKEGERRAKVIIHDVLSLGVAVMAVASVSLSLFGIPATEVVAEKAVLK
ncbi:MAG: 3-methylornithyl-N6-L-lysine dehydrogenase PylD [Methanomassiliicoccaceae archaeon]|jgi:pyrrolysine biosynthesis protein PylD|nr:3-methylornithyl-N6-L-lysine dehydrogenase PylD [Methanomassiliicoccaceae archaeon]